MDVAGNPFRIHGIVQRPAFTNREAEIARMRSTLREPGAKLLVYGERRLGKTSTLVLAAQEHTAKGGAAFIADFSTATSAADLANRVLDGATKALGRRWRDVIVDLTKRLGFSIELGVDPVSSAPTASLSLRARDATQEEQRATLGHVLDSLDELCAARRVSLGIILDEFQDIHRFGGEAAEWHLRGVIQHHQHLSYIVAGSKTQLIRRMISEGSAFYKLFDVLAFGPMESSHIAGWIDEQLSEAGVAAHGVGEAILRVAGPRTRDVVQVARKVFDLGREARAIDISIVERAFVEIVQEEADPLQTLWQGYSAIQTNVLRAVAHGTTSLTRADVLRRFGIASSSSAIKAATRLVDTGALEIVAPGHYRFDSPFQRAWVILNALPDVGLHLSPVFVPEG